MKNVCTYWLHISVKQQTAENYVCTNYVDVSNNKSEVHLKTACKTSSEVSSEVFPKSNNYI